MTGSPESLDSESVPNPSESSFSAREKRLQELRLWVPTFLAEWLTKLAHENYYQHRNKYVTHLLMEMYRRAHGR